MNAKATEFLADLYETSEPPALSTAKAAPAPELGRVHPGAGRPVDLGDLLPADGLARRRPGGRVVAGDERGDTRDAAEPRRRPGRRPKHPFLAK
jgi:hypothetical protein